MLERLKTLRRNLARLHELPEQLASVELAANAARHAAELADARAAGLQEYWRSRPRNAQLLLLWSAPPRSGLTPCQRCGDLVPTDSMDVHQAQHAHERFQSLPPEEVIHRVYSQHESPTCAAVGFDVSKRQHVSFEQLHHPVPAGAWLVAIGCTMHTVCVGNDIQTATLGAKLRVARLKDPIRLGVLLRAQVEPEEAEQR